MRHFGSLFASSSHGCVRLDPANAAKLYALVQQEGVTATTVTVTGSVSIAIARRHAPVTSAEASTAPLSLRPAADTPPSVAVYRAGSYYENARDDRFAPRLYRQPAYQACDSRFAEPPAPPPGYPSYPRHGFFIDDGR